MLLLAHFSKFFRVSIDVEDDSNYEMVYLNRDGDDRRLTEIDIKRMEESYRYDIVDSDEEDKI